jgi:hypothetical protein
MDGQRALELMPLLQERLVILTGGRDRRGGPVLSFPASPRRERAKPEDYKRLLQYLMSIPKQVFFFLYLTKWSKLITSLQEVTIEIHIYLLFVFI